MKNSLYPPFSGRNPTKSNRSNGAARGWAWCAIALGLMLGCPPVFGKTGVDYQGDWLFSYDTATHTAAVTYYVGESSSPTVPSHCTFPMDTDSEGKPCDFHTFSVTAIEYAFDGNETITHVTLPASVTNIGNASFYHCSNLKSISAGGEPKRIGEFAFSGCSQLTGNLDLSECRVIEEGAFWGCSSWNFGHLALPSVTSLGGGAFGSCLGLSSVSLPAALTRIEGGAFAYCSALSSVSLPSALTSIGESAFAGCSSLQSVSFPSTLTLIEERAFEGCSELKSVETPSSLQRLGYYAFCGCSNLVSARIDGTGLILEEMALGGCPNLETIEFGDGVIGVGEPIWLGLGYLLAGDEKLRTLTVGTGLTTIPSWFCEGFGALETVTLRGNVQIIGGAAFSGCVNLRAISIGGKPIVVGGHAFANCGRLTRGFDLSDCREIQNCAFYGCDALEFRNLTLPSATSIGEWAFTGCSGLTAVETSSSLQTLEDGAFLGCSNLVSARIDGTDLLLGTMSLGGCPNLETIELGDGVIGFEEKEGWEYYSEYPYGTPFGGDEKLRTLTVGTGFTSIPPYFCDGLGSLETAIFRGNIQTIGGNAFSGCGNLQTFSIGGKPTGIGGWAFYNCRQLPGSLDFSECQEIHGYAFQGCEAWDFGTLDLPKIIRIGIEGFHGCLGLGGVHFPSSLAIIEEHSFGDCGNLTNVWFAGGVPTADNSFGAKSVFNEVPSGARGYYTANHAAEWLAVLDADGKWEGLRMLEISAPELLPEQTVTFKANGGECDTETGTFTKGGTYGSLPTAKWGGYKFDGWFTEEIGGTEVRGSSTVTTDDTRTLWAHWTPGTQSMLFNPAGGICSTVSMTYTVGEPYGSLPKPKWAGYRFDGWWTIDEEKVTEESIVTTNATRSVFAHWIYAMQIVDFDANGGSGVFEVLHATIGEPYGKLPGGATKTGYLFGGWWTKKTGGTEVTADSIVTDESHVRLYVHWLPDWQTVTFEANGGECGTATAKYLVGEKYVDLPSATRAGFEFEGWWTEAEEGTLVTTNSTVTAALARRLWAHWAVWSQRVTFDANGGTCGTAAKTYPVGEAYGTLPTPKCSGNAFLGWWTEQDGGELVTAESLVEAVAELTLYAHWTDQQVTMFKGNGGKPSTQVTTNTIYTDYGTFPEAKWSGHALVGWFNAPEGGKRVYTNSTVTLAATRTLYAQWTTNQVTTFKANGGYPATQKTTNDIYTAYGAFPEVKYSGHALVGWFNAPESGKRIYTNSTVTLAATRTLYAQWTTNQVTTFKGNGGTPEIQKTTNAIYTHYGTLPEAVWENHAFLGWFNHPTKGKRVYTNSTVTLSATRSLYAHWTDQQVVTFKGNGGTPKTQAATNTMGGAYGTLPTPKWSGHVFLGWFTEAESGTEVEGTDKVTAATARTLYAHWTDQQMTVFKGNGGTPETQVTTNTIYADYGELPTAKRSGYALVGWFNAPEGGKRVYTNSTVTLAAERTLYAQWTNQQVTTFKGNGGTPATQKTTNTIYAKYGAFPSVEWSGHVFQGWYNAAEGGKRVYTNSTVTLAATRTLYAHWTTAKGFAITAIAVGAGEGEDGPSPRAVRGEDRAENVYRLRFELSEGTEYEIQWTASMAGEWETVERLTAETDGEVEVEIEVPGEEKGFFRLVVFGDSGKAD